MAMLFVLDIMRLLYRQADMQDSSSNRYTYIHSER